ncbi:hypothetical protein AA0119_g12669 [Alternaria tenuissima]|uniref:Chromo domain-containing protein n=1 Tax=Alternaria tenuissima TaxID=119927 RepID=A0ABY0FSQ2_9PLEO|nr:hypothetical protein AA0119_g12669 [Alternaria tenuissima]RYO04422.1 hypothetical protein AA0121_g12787 [Alternaria tenuissima]
MPSFVANFPVASRAFIQFDPSSIKSKSTTTKRRLKIKALEDKSSDKRTIENCSRFKDASILSGPTPVLPCSSNKVSPILLVTAESGFILNNQVIHAGAAALDQNQGGCEVGDKASIMEEKQDVADTAKTNAAADIFAVHSTSGQCAFLAEDVATTEHCRSTSIHHDVRMPQPHQEIGSQFADDGHHPRIMHEELGDTETCAPPIYDTHSRATDVSSPAICNSAATGTSLGSGEQLPSLPGISTCEAKSPDCRLQSDQQDGSLEAWTAPNTAELSPIPTADDYVSGFRSDCNREPAISAGMTAFDMADRAESPPESEVGQELLQSTDRSISLLKAAGQDVPSDWTNLRDKDRKSDIESTDSSGKRSRAHIVEGEEEEEKEEEEEDRYEVEQIMNHDGFKGWTRYLVKWLDWPEEYNTWEPEINLDRCPDPLKEYWARVKNHNSDGIVTEPGACSSQSDDRMQDDQAPRPRPMIEIPGQGGQGPLRLQDSLVAQRVYSEGSDKAASRCRARKRKLSEDSQGFLDEDLGSLDGDWDPEVRSRGRRVERGGRRTTSKPHVKRCRRCREMGHNARTCPSGAVSISE